MIDRVLVKAAEVSLQRAIQFWDAVVCAAAEATGATILLTEDLRDGCRLNNPLLLNPLVAKNDALIGAALDA